MSYTYKGAPIWSVGLTLLIPGLITHLSLYPRTQVLRMGLLPIALWGFWNILWNYNFDTHSIRWNSIYIHHPAQCTSSTPPTPSWVLENQQYLQNIQFTIIRIQTYQYPSQPTSSTTYKTRSKWTRILFINNLPLHQYDFHLTLLDIILYPAYILDPTGIGSPYPGGGGDLRVFCERYGRSEWVIWGWMSIAAGAGMCVATMGTYHLFALIGVGSGIWIDEEFPRFMDQPWRADSLNDLWGKRYHQDTLILWTKPFENLPKSIYILTIFLASALFHIIISIPFDNSTKTPYLIFYTSQGIGCILERVYRNVTGKRVNGLSGRIWTLGWVMFWAGWMVPEYYRTGWVGMMRGTLHEGGMSPADALVKWLRQEG